MRKYLGTTGFSLIEVLLAVAAFSLITTALTGLFIYGRESGALSGNRQRASLLADEGLEAVRSIRDQNFTNLTDGTHGLALVGGQWVLQGTSDNIDGYTRQVVISSVNASSKNITVTINWQQNLQRSGTVSVASQLTNWRTTAATNRKGILVYGDGGTTTDAIKYRVLDESGVWGAAAATADVDGATTNKALRTAQIHASSSRNEKVLLSRHYNGSAQFIYAQVFNGTSWANVQLLSNWSNSTFLDVQNFSGTYLANGDFMVVYSDNTAIPKSRIWNGTAWSAQVALPSIGGIPNYIVTKARPGTSEVMAAFFDQSNDTNTAYFNGGGYVTGSWALSSQHAGNAPANTKRLVDFAWSPNSPLKGSLVYANNSNEKQINMRIWTANGSGGGSWTPATNAFAQTSNVGALSVVGVNGIDEFMACNKDATAIPQIICYKADITGVWANPTNGLIGLTDTGIQASYGLDLEAQSGELGLAVYSDGTMIPKLKKYTTATSTWDFVATNLNTLGGALETSRLVADPQGNDVMILLADTNQDLYSIGWDGSANAVFTTPTGKAFSSHGTNGVADENFWFDFAWDGF